MLKYFKMFFLDNKYYFIVLFAGMILGGIIGFNYAYKFIEPQIVYKTEVIDNNKNQKDSKETVKIETDIKTNQTSTIAYNNKETIVQKQQDGSYKEYIEKTDVDVKVNKPNLNVNVNGKNIELTKAEDEKYLFENNKLTFEQSSNVNFTIKTQPVYIDKTKYFGIGAYTNGKKSGTMIAAEFPLIKKIQLSGSILYNPHERKGYGGVIFRF